ncbi:MAG: YidC/Oxa1 family insertase periplasmic-domain containing protein, partial [Lentisphaeria bacterium]|nr:YidC/Oxa1 family insertase periplasmic-domain containing protein [Lentisphaeria bacterium]
MDSKDKFIVIVLFIILGMWFTNQFKKAPKPGTQGTGTGTTQSDSTVQKTVGKNPENPENPKNQGTDTTKPVTLIAKPEINLLETFKDLKAAEKQTLKMNGLCDIIIDPEKGGIVDVSLKNYKSEDKLTNFHLGLEDYPMLALEGSLGEDGKGKLEFSHALILKSTDTELKIERQLKGTDLVIIQHWIIDYGYTIKYSVTIDNRGTSAIKVPKLQLNAGTMSPMDTPKGFFGAGGIDQRIQFLEIGEDGSDYEQIQKVQNFSGDKKELADEIKALHLTWLSIQNKFFLSILSNGDLTGSTFKTVKYGDEEDKRHVLIGYVSLKQELLNPKEKTIII